jgi:hypothetical protein
MVFEAANDTTNRYTEIAYFPESRQSEGVPQVVVIGPDAFRRQAAQALNAVPQRPQTSDIEKALRTVVGQELDVNKAAGMVIVVSAQEGGGRLRYDVIGKNQPGFRVFHHREGVAVPTRWDPPDVRGITQVSLGSPVQLDVRARDTRNPFALSIKPKY